VETPIREVVIHRAELVSSERERAEFEIECSSGTYVRTLIETLEDAYCESLRRTAIGPFQVPAGGDAEISVEELMGFLPDRPLDAAEAERVGHGVPVEARLDAPGDHVRLTHGGRLIAVARRDGENLRPEVVLS
jgi:tRNA pseudouridine55 synthase